MMVVVFSLSTTASTVSTHLESLNHWLFHSSDNLLVNDKLGVLRCLYCLFSSVWFVQSQPIAEEENMSVNAIKLTMEVKRVLIIKGTACYIIYFKI